MIEQLARNAVYLKTMEHILTNRDASGQKTIWDLVKQLWQHKGLQWPEPEIGSILGCGIINFHDAHQKPLPGASVVPVITGHEHLKSGHGWLGRILT
jgi:hypothetical protein